MNIYVGLEGSFVICHVQFVSCINIKKYYFYYEIKFTLEDSSAENKREQMFIDMY